ncbi:MAG: ABC transporter permease [Cyanobacteria bacterium]|nr:ABC transporter permease [Cyanobacteriota bacterium]
MDLKGALRGLRKNPGFAAAALLTLSLGIGATSAIFSVVKAVLLTPLPYEAPEKRVMLWSKWANTGKTWISSQEALDYRALAKTLTGVGYWANTSYNLTESGEPARLTAGLISANLFDVLGARPLIGRGLIEEDDRPTSAPVAILSHALWASRFNGDARIVGQRIMLNGVAVEVIGVMPEGFRLPTDFTADAAEPTELWRPFRLARANRNAHTLYGAAVLAPGQTADTATAELRAITTRLTEQGEYPAAMQFTAFAVSLDDEIRGGLRPAMWLLTGAVGFLLLIACVNVANLLLVRGDARMREMAVRTALGAAPSRLVRQLFTESLVLALTGAALGLALATAALRVLTSVDPTSLPRVAPIGLDATVIIFTLITAVVTTLLFGLVPALRTLPVDVVDSLRDGSQHSSIGHHRQRLRAALVSLEVAMAVVLVIGAGLMIRTLTAIGNIDLGFNPDHVMTMRVTIPGAKYATHQAVINFYDELQSRVSTLPGVEAAGIMRALPLATTVADFAIDVEGFEESPGREAQGDLQVVSHGAFAAMQTRLVRGRFFTPADTAATMLVAVVNETMARTYWADPAAAIGGRIRVGPAPRPWVTVVGVAADERHDSVTGVVDEKFFVPNPQWEVIANGGDPIRSVFLVARTAGEPLSVAAAIRGEVRQMDASLPVSNMRTMNEVVATALATPRLTGFLLSAFAAIALALAAVGIYGVLAYVVSQRTQEIGIRLAIGADRSQVLRMVLRQGLLLAGIGVVAGLIGAYALTRLMASLLYDVRPNDPLTFAGVAAALLLIALAASFLPARRATRVSLTTALRAE